MVGGYFWLRIERILSAVARNTAASSGVSERLAEKTIQSFRFLKMLSL